MKKMERATRGMNTPNAPKCGPSASNAGMQTAGVSLTQGYKTVSLDGRSPQAVPQNTGRKGG